MAKSEKYNYIFAPDPNHNNEIRFNWIYNCLLGDIQTFLDGIENYIKNKGKFSDNLPRGGGNLSIPICISTCLEFVSSLYIGKTKYRDDKNYNATKNVQKFIDRFFPINYRNIPLLFWDGVRNGIVHTFSPKPFEYKDIYIRFQFFVEDRNEQSRVIKDKKTIMIKINIFKLYELLKKAVQDYRTELKNNENLQDKFILAWSSVEEYTRNIDTDVGKSNEAKALLSTLMKNKVVLLS